MTEYNLRLSLQNSTLLQSQTKLIVIQNTFKTVKQENYVLKQQKAEILDKNESLHEKVIELK